MYLFQFCFKFPKHLGLVDHTVVDLDFVYSKTWSYILLDDLLSLSTSQSFNLGWN